MRTLSQILAAATLSAVAGCSTVTSVRHTPVAVTPPRDVTLPPPRPLVPTPPIPLRTVDDYQRAYESHLPTQLEGPITIPLQQAEERIRQRGVQLYGHRHEGWITALDDILRDIPKLNPCPVYILRDQLEAGRNQSLGGWYNPSGPGGPLIALLDSQSPPAMRETAAHEQIHREADLVGNPLLNDWATVNRYPYGHDLRVRGDRVHEWTDGTSAPRHGYIRPYAASRASEDIATHGGIVRRQPEALRPCTGETRDIILNKVRILERYQLVNAQEAARARQILGSNDPPEPVRRIEPEQTQTATAENLAQADIYLALGVLLACTTLVTAAYFSRNR